MDRDLQSIQEVRRLLERAAEAQARLEHFSQEQIDAAVRACAEAAKRHAEPLARLAVEETTYGVVADKVVKNLFASQDVYARIKDLKTVGVVREDAVNGVVEIAVPAGVVAAIVPTTNPTSTAIFKALISLKARNAVVMSPHPNAVRCISETVRILDEAARQAGAPEGALNCLTEVTNEATHELMHHRLTAIILATGGTGLVRAAYSSGKPALGVGPGNVPAYIHASADVRKAAADILTGKCFDNGTLCSSEQHMVVESAVAAQAKEEASRLGGYFLSPEQAAAVAQVLILPNFRVNSQMVGQSAEKIARAAGFDVPAGTRALVAPLDGIGRKYPLSAEKLSPVLSFYVVKDTKEGLEVCERFLRFGGMGHTMSIHATDDRVIREFGLKLPAFRMIVNSPASYGSVGYTTRLFPSLSLGCGTPGNNITSDNISPLHLLNIKRLAYEKRPANVLEGGKMRTRTYSEMGPAAILPAGVSSAPSPVLPSAPPAAPRTVTASVVAALSPEISRLIDRLTEARAANPAPAAPAAAAPAAAAPASNPPAAPPPPPRAVDFVSEEDVRQALAKGQKIYVGPRTIITPSARDLGNPAEIFVPAKS